jgi:hypothetical protein
LKSFAEQIYLNADKPKSTFVFYAFTRSGLVQLLSGAGAAWRLSWAACAERSRIEILLTAFSD